MVVFDCPYPDSKVRGANMGPTWGRQAPGEPHVGPIIFAIRVSSVNHIYELSGVTHVINFRNYGKLSTGPSTFEPQVRTYGKLFPYKSVIFEKQSWHFAKHSCSYKIMLRLSRA